MCVWKRIAVAAMDGFSKIVKLARRLSRMPLKFIYTFEKNQLQEH